MASIVGGPSGASVPGHARTGLERGRIWAAIWIPGANPVNVVRGARGIVFWLRSLASRAPGMGRGDGTTAIIRQPLLITRFARPPTGGLSKAARAVRDR